MAVTILLSDAIEAYLELLVEEGRFESRDAAVEAALELMLETDEAKDIAFVRAALKEAERSGTPIEVDFDEVLGQRQERWNRKKSTAAE